VHLPHALHEPRRVWHRRATGDAERDVLRLRRDHEHQALVSGGAAEPDVLAVDGDHGVRVQVEDQSAQPVSQPADRRRLIAEQALHLWIHR
jgi:hypothetical protein